MNPLMMTTGAARATLAPRPPALDSNVSRYRPDSRRIGAITVAKDGSGHRSTVKGAYQEAADIQAARLQALGNTALDPNYGVDVIVADGVYGETVVNSSFVHLFGAGSSRVSVTGNFSEAQRGTFEGLHNGYVEGVTIVHPTDAPAVTVYPVHTATEHTSTWCDVVFDNKTGGAAFGSDGGENGFLYFYRCGFITGVNIHGSSAQALAKTISYVNCTFTGDAGYNSMHPTAPDDVWVKNTTAAGLRVYGAGTRTHISGSTIAGTIVTEGTRDTLSNGPEPLGGLSPYDRLYYGIPYTP